MCIVKDEDLRVALASKGFTLLLFGITLSTLLAAWYLTFPSSEWADTPNYFAMYLDFIIAHPSEALLSISTGPSNAISWTIVLAYGFPVVLVLLYWKGKKDGGKYVLMNGCYIAYLAVLCFSMVTLQNAAQYYGWYMNLATGGQGYVDTWTHTVSPWYVGALIAPLGGERLWGWDRRLFWVPIVMSLSLIAVGWEVTENVDLVLRPGAYVNATMDSLKDIIFGAVVASVLSSWLYQRIVMDAQRRG